MRTHRSSASPSRRGAALVTACLAALLLAAPAPVFAQKSDDAAGDTDPVEDQALKLFAEGSKLYREGKYKESITKLQKAYSMRPAPPLLLNIARAYQKLNDKKGALRTYRLFLRKARLMNKARGFVSKMVKQLEKETGDKGSTGSSLHTHGAARTRGGSGGSRSRAQQLIHTPVDSAKVRKPIDITAELPPDTRADAVTVHYRRQGQRRFRKLRMSLQGDAYVARIPGRHVRTTSLQYYIEARRIDRKKAVATAGTRRNPQIVVIEGGKKPSLDGKREELRSPYRTWLWVGIGATAALVGGTVATAILAADRANAIEEIAFPNSNNRRESFDLRGRDWESQGKTFATLSAVFLGVSIAAAGATGYLFYLDRKWLRRERAKRALDDARAPRKRRVVRFYGAPWAAPNGAGFVGRIDF